MKIVIAGGGVVGQTIAEELADEGIDISLIEESEDLLEKIIGRIDITGLAGNTASYDNLMEAGVDQADIFISVTSSDEINLISAIMAKRIGAKFTIVRVRNPEYTKHGDFMRRDLGITMLINPEWEAARDIVQTVKFPEANSVEYFAQGQVVLVEVLVKEDSVLNGMRLSRFGSTYDDVLVLTIEREDDVFVPKGDSTILADDSIFIIGSRPSMNSFYKEAGFRNERIHNSMIIGDGRIPYYLVDLLDDIHVDVKVISSNYDRAKYFSQAFPRALVIHGDTADQDFLQEERIASYDSVIAMSEHDEENILNSLYALSEDVPKVITRVSNVRLLKILGDIELQTTITPKYIMTNRILRFVRSLSNTSVSSVEGLIRIANNEVEVLQFLVKEGCRSADIPLTELKLKDNTLIAFIMRGKQLIIPLGRDMIKVGDHVIVATRHRHFDDIDDILASSKEE